MTGSWRQVIGMALGSVVWSSVMGVEASPPPLPQLAKIGGFDEYAILKPDMPKADYERFAVRFESRQVDSLEGSLEEARVALPLQPFARLRQTRNPRP